MRPIPPGVPISDASVYVPPPAGQRRSPDVPTSRAADAAGHSISREHPPNIVEAGDSSPIRSRFDREVNGDPVRVVGRARTITSAPATGPLAPAVPFRVEDLYARSVGDTPNDGRACPSGGSGRYRPRDLERTKPEWFGDTDSSPLRSPPLPILDGAATRLASVVPEGATDRRPASARKSFDIETAAPAKPMRRFEISWWCRPRTPHLVRERKRNRFDAPIRTRFVRDSFRLPGGREDRDDLAAPAAFISSKGRAIAATLC